MTGWLRSWQEQARRQEGAIGDDRLGLELSTSAQAGAACVDGADRLLAAWPGAHERLQHALELDPDFALGHAALAELEGMLRVLASVQFGSLRARTVRATVAGMPERRRWMARAGLP
jgi:hypothetical protein